MKLGDFFRLPQVRILSVIFGMFCGFPLLFIVDWKYAVLVGASATLLTSLILPLVLYREEKAYRKIKSRLPQPFVLDERVRFTIKDGSIGGYLVLTDSSLILLSLEKGTHRLELKRSQIQKIVVGNEMTTISIYLNNTQFVQVFSTACEEMHRVLLENGWGN